MLASNRWKKVVIILLAVAAMALFAGGYVYYNYAFPGNPLNCFWMSMQNCVETLLFNPILPIQGIVADKEFIAFMGPAEQFVIGAYFLAMVLVPLADILIIFSIIESFLHLFVGIGAMKSRRILIVGYNDDVRKLLDRKNRNGKVYLWTERFLSTEEERELYAKRVSVKMQDYSLGDSPEEYPKQKKRFDQFIKRKNITDILLLHESEAKNCLYYMALASSEICKERTIHFYVMNESFESKNMLQDYFDYMRSQFVVGKKIPEGMDTHLDLHIFNNSQILAEQMFLKLPAYVGNSHSDKHVHLLIAGGDSLCMYIALHAMNQSVFSPDNRIVIDIVNDTVDGIRECLARRFDKTMVKTPEDNVFEIPSDKVDGELRIRLTECSIMGNSFTTVLNELQDENSGRFTYIALCSSNVYEILRIFKCIETGRLIPEEAGVPIAVRMTYSEEMEKYLSSYSWCRKLFFMGEDDEYVGLDQIVDLEEEKYIRAYNAAYEAVSRSRIYAVGSLHDERLRINKETLWNAQEYYSRQSNRALYFHKFVKEFMFGDYSEEMQKFWEQTVLDDKKDKDLIWSEYLVEEGEYPKLLEMAETEHRRWCYFFISEGWKYAEKKDPSLRIHNCLCTWEQLSSDPNTKGKLIYDLISSPLLMEEIS